MVKLNLKNMQLFYVTLLPLLLGILLTHVFFSLKTETQISMFTNEQEFSPTSGVILCWLL